MDDTPATPALLQVALERAGITYAAVAAAVDKDTSVVWRWVSGAGRVPLDRAIRLLDALGLDEPERSALARSIAADHGVTGDLAAALRGGE